MGLFNKFFKSDKLKQPVDLSSISTDIHAHLIPGIDDGVQNMEDAVELIRSLHNYGYKKIVATPHVTQDYFKNTPETILTGLEKLKVALAEAHIPIQMEAAAEYMLDEGFVKKFHAGELLTFGNKYVLIELSPFFAPENLFQVLFDLKLDGYNPILAHPERYAYLHTNIEHYNELKDREIFFQINIPSLSDFYTKQVRKIAEQLIDNEMVEFVGTDLHSKDYLDHVEMSRFSKHLEKLLNSGKLMNKDI